MPRSCEDLILEPLGLHATFYDPATYPPELVARMAHGYFENTACAEYQPPDCAETWNQPLIGRDVRGDSTSWAQAAGGAIATARDVDTWMRAVFEGRVVPPKQQAEWLALVSTRTGEPIADVSPEDPQGFALGLVKAILAPYGDVWFYQGTTLGFRTLYVWFEAEDLLVTVQTNSQPDDDENRLQDAVIAIYDAPAAKPRTLTGWDIAARSLRAPPPAAPPASRAPSARGADAASPAPPRRAAPARSRAPASADAAGSAPAAPPSAAPPRARSTPAPSPRPAARSPRSPGGRGRRPSAPSAPRAAAPARLDRLQPLQHRLGRQRRGERRRPVHIVRPRPGRKGRRAEPPAPRRHPEPRRLERRQRRLQRRSRPAQPPSRDSPPARSGARPPAPCGVNGLSLAIGAHYNRLKPAEI